MFDDEGIIQKHTRAQRRLITEAKKEKLRSGVLSYYSRVGYVEWDYVDGVFSPIGKYVKRNSRSRAKRNIKRITNRRVRHSCVSFGKGNQHRLGFDAWNIY